MLSTILADRYVLAITRATKKTGKSSGTSHSHALVWCVINQMFFPFFCYFAFWSLSFVCESLFYLCDPASRASTSRFLPGGNITNPLRSMNSSFIDNTDYQSLQGFPAAVKDLTQTYASMSYNQDFYNGFSRCDH